jgi:CRP/FNR family transcriptional regulator, cyclic AMP receptor protein
VKAATQYPERLPEPELNGILKQFPRPESCTRRTPLATFLEPETCLAMDALGDRQWFDRGAILFRAGDIASNLFVIISGRVKVMLYSPDGEEALGTVLGAGEIIGATSVLEGSPRAVTATADERTQVLVFAPDVLERLIGTSPTVAMDIYRIMARQLKRSYAFIEDTIFLDVAGRVAKKLLELGETYGEETDIGIIIDLPLTQMELATMVGVTRETVNKHLGAYRARGIIDVRDHRIVILKPETLRRRIY